MGVGLGSTHWVGSSGYVGLAWITSKPTETTSSRPLLHQPPRTDQVRSTL